jgi:cytochrome c peroxidase
MHGEPISARDMEDMFAFLTSLDSPPPPKLTSRELLDQGRKIFESRGCINCHAPPAYTTPITADVGLLDEQGRNRFNPPSLRGVSQRRRFFHDGRAASLEDVLNTVRHQLDEPLSQKDAEALLAFLRSI